LVRRKQRRISAGDWDSNIYHLDGLVRRVQALELRALNTRLSEALAARCRTLDRFEQVRPRERIALPRTTEEAPERAVTTLSSQTPPAKA
jgi:hypothetical protein